MSYVEARRADALMAETLDSLWITGLGFESQRKPITKKQREMVDMETDLQTIRHQARQRQARLLVDQLDELRAAKCASDRGLTQRQIAELLYTSQPKIHRLLKALERRSGSLDAGPEELILRAFAYDTSREELLRVLKAITYTFGEDAPCPHEGRLPGTWDQIVNSLAKGILKQTEFDELRHAIGR